MELFGDMNYDTVIHLPKVDLSKLNQPKFSVASWATKRSEVIHALESYGCFEVVYNQVQLELLDVLLGQVVPELFNAPKIGELLNPEKVPYHGYLFQKEGYPFLSLQLAKLDSIVMVEEQIKMVWPHGNSFFSNTIWDYVVNMQELLQVIHRMIFEGLGLEDLYNPYMKSMTYSMRLSKYHKDLSSNRKEVELPSHRDPNYISIICQNKSDGLEIEAPNGEWIHISPSPNSFIVILGEAFMAWTNGRLKAPNHRVKMNGSEKRYAVVYSTIPSKSNDMIKSPMELVDKEHPLMYKPFKYYDYLNFRFSDEGEKHEDTLKVYCGV